MNGIYRWSWRYYWSISRNIYIAGNMNGVFEGIYIYVYNWRYDWIK